jgi:hypothetical protein
MSLRYNLIVYILLLLLYWFAVVCIDIPTQCYKYYLLIQSEYNTVHLNSRNCTVIHGTHGAGAGAGFKRYY